MSNFLKCVTFHFEGKECEIKCKLGLWSVKGRDYRKIHSKAKPQWKKFFDAGEYDELLKTGESGNAV